MAGSGGRKASVLKVAVASVVTIGGLAAATVLYRRQKQRKEEARTFGPYDYPTTRKCNQVDELHGTEVEDPYRWLEDPYSPEVQRWVERQNKCSKKYIDGLGEDLEKFKTKMTELFTYDKYGCPTKYGDWIFFLKKEGLQNQFVFYKQKDEDGAQPEVLLDVNTLREDGTAALKTYAFTKDGTKMAYGVSFSGSDWFEIKVKDVATGQDLGDRLEHCKFSGVAWAPGGAGFFYARYPPPPAAATKGREDGAGTEVDAATQQKLYYHRLGTPQEQDQVVFEDPENPKWLYGSEVSDDGAYLLVTIGESCDPVNRLYLYPLAGFDGRDVGTLGPVVKVVDHFEHKYDYITNEGRKFWFFTNKDAPKYKVATLELPEGDLAALSPDALAALPTVDVVPEDEGAVLEGVAVTAGCYLLLLYLKDVQSKFEIARLDGSGRRAVALPGVGSITGLSAKKEQGEFFYQFMGFQDPGTTFRVRVAEADGATTMAPFQRTEVPGLDPSEFSTRQVFYSSKDGTKVPMFIINHKEAPEGPGPTLLYGYGGFNISITPGFSLNRLLWVKHFGGTVAIANIRGGGEYGEEWHKAGTLHNKQNVFDDFIAAAEYLHNAEISSPSQLAIQGGSNGGLLVGACINQRPELFAAAVAQVGVMDMLRFHKFTIGYAWCSDYGNADKDAAEFRTLRAYSPVHNVGGAAGPYPATLLTTGDHDDRVVPLHSYKYAAALQNVQGARPEQAAPLLIRIDTKSGHGAGKPTSKQIEEVSEMVAFIAKNTGATWKD